MTFEVWFESEVDLLFLASSLALSAKVRIVWDNDVALGITVLYTRMTRKLHNDDCQVFNHDTAKIPIKLDFSDGRHYISACNLSHKRFDMLL